MMMASDCLRAHCSAWVFRPHSNKLKSTPDTGLGTIVCGSDGNPPRPLASGRVDNYPPILGVRGWGAARPQPGFLFRTRLPLVPRPPSLVRASEPVHPQQNASRDLILTCKIHQILQNLTKIMKIKIQFFFRKKFLQIVQNAFCRSFAAIGAMFAEFVGASAGFAKRKQFY